VVEDSPPTDRGPPDGTPLRALGVLPDRSINPSSAPESTGRTARYFQLCDQPVTGRYDGENYNLGFVNQVDLPYPEMVWFARETHRRMVPVHAGSTTPADRMAKVR